MDRITLSGIDDPEIRRAIGVSPSIDQRIERVGWRRRQCGSDIEDAVAPVSPRRFIKPNRTEQHAPSVNSIESNLWEETATHRHVGIVGGLQSAEIRSATGRSQADDLKSTDVNIVLIVKIPPEE